MEDKSLELMTEEQRKLHEEFTQCQNWEEVEIFLKKVEKLNESRGNEKIPHLDMTLEEFDAKYKLATLEDIQRKMGRNWRNLLRSKTNFLKQSETYLRNLST